MATFKDLEDNLKSFIVQEQSDAHSVRNLNLAKYNNIKLWMDPAKYVEPHFFVQISISQAAFTISSTTKLTGGLGSEERLVLKWTGRMGVRQKLDELWSEAQTNKQDK